MIYLLQDLAERLYDESGCPVTIADNQDTVLAYSEQPEELTDEARRMMFSRRRTPASTYVTEFARGLTAPALLEPHSELGVVGHYIVPIRAGGRVVGYLDFIDPDAVLDAERLEPFADDLSEVGRLIELEWLSMSNMRSAIGSLVSSDQVERRVASLAIADSVRVTRTQPALIAIVGSRNDEPLDPLLRSLIPSKAIWAANQQNRIYLLASSALGDLDALIQAMVRSAAATPELAIGIGEPFPDLLNAAGSHRQARSAMAFARSGLGGSPVAEWRMMGPWRTLLSLGRAEALASIDPRVAQLISAEDKPTMRLLLEYLGHDKDVGQLAFEHHLHRTTLYSRLRRLQIIYELDWRSTEDRLSTILGLRISLIVPWI